MLRFMKRRVAISAALLGALFLVNVAGAKDDFPPPDQVFRYLVEAKGNCLTISWDVAPGYYLYKDRLGVESGTPGVTVGAPDYPKGETHHDEYFGEQEIYRDDFTVTAPLTEMKAGTHEITVKLKLQGCADAGLCYPPSTWETKVTVSPESQ